VHIPANYGARLFIRKRKVVPFFCLTVYIGNLAAPGCGLVLLEFGNAEIAGLDNGGMDWTLTDECVGS